MRRGDVYWVQLQPRSGSEQQGRRPAIIVSENRLNDIPSWKSIIVIPVSTSPNQRRGPTAIPLPLGSAGLTQESIALCHQITTLDRAKFVQKIGTLPAGLVNEIDAGIKVALQLL